MTLLTEYASTGRHGNISASQYSTLPLFPMFLKSLVFCKAPHCQWAGLHRIILGVLKRASFDTSVFSPLVHPSILYHFSFPHTTYFFMTCKCGVNLLCVYYKYKLLIKKIMLYCFTKHVSRSALWAFSLRLSFVV